MIAALPAAAPATGRTAGQQQLRLGALRRGRCGGDDGRGGRRRMSRRRQLRPCAGQALTQQHLVRSATPLRQPRHAIVVPRQECDRVRHRVRWCHAAPRRRSRPSRFEFQLLCGGAGGGRFTACALHFAPTSLTVAVAACTLRRRERSRALRALRRRCQCAVQARTSGRSTEHSTQWPPRRQCRAADHTGGDRRLDGRLHGSDGLT